MANKDTILTIYDSDIISESMHKINYNFELLLNKDDVSDWKLSKLEQKINNELENIRRTSDERASGFSRDLDDLEELLEGLHSHEEIQAMVDNAIRNAESSLRGFITTMAGEQISEMIGGFAKDADITRLQGLIDGLNGRIDGLENNTSGDDTEYVSSEAFTQYKADAANRQAEANMMAANSTFKRNEDGYYILWDPDNPDSDEPSIYKSLADFYTANINEFDPDRLGLSDPDVYKRFLTACETTFKSVFTELAQIRAYVEDGAAGFDIMAAIDHDGHNIAAAIFGWANKEGSGITLTADHVEIDSSKFVVYGEDIIMDSSHRLALVTDGFTITSTNFNVNLNGDVSMTGDLTAKTLSTESGNTRIDSAGYLYTKNAEIEGNLTATTLTAANGNTTIDANGVLHANGADISGSITAEKFSATETTSTTVTDENNVEFTGDLTRNTVIDGNQFLITATGTLESTNSSKNIANSIYIETVDVMDNDNNNIGTTVNGSFVKDQKLYGVPQLRMRYNGMTFALNPSMWSKIEEGGGTVLSNMRWIHQFTGPIYEFNIPQANSLLASYCIQGNVSFDDGNSCTYYLFRPEDNAHSSYKFLTKGISNESVYRLGVDNWGDDKSGNAQLLLSNGLRKNETVGDDLPYYGAYTTQTSLVNHGGMGYTEFGSTTTIEDNYSTYASYLPTSTINCGKKIEETPHSYGNISDNTYGTSNIINVMRNLYKAGIDSYSTSQSYNIWKMLINGTYQDCMITGGVGINLDDYLPYGSNTSTKTATEKITCYPLSTIDNNGLDINDTITTIWVSYSLDTTTTYSFANNSLNTKYLQISYQDYIYNNGQWIDTGIKFQPSIFSSKISFDFVMKMNNGVVRSDAEIKNKVFECLRKMNIGIFNTDYSKHINFYKYVKLEAFINSPTFIMFRDSYR